MLCYILYIILFIFFILSSLQILLHSNKNYFFKWKKKRKLYSQFTFAPRIIFSPIISPITPDTCPVYFTLPSPTLKFRQTRVNIRYVLRSTGSTPEKQQQQTREESLAWIPPQPFSLFSNGPGSVYSHSCVSCFLFQSPPKGATIPYRPKPQVGGPVILAGGQAYTIQGNYAVPAHSDVSTVLPLPAPAAGPTPPSLNTQTLTTSPFAAHPSSSAFAASHGHPLLSTAHLTTPHHPLHPSPLHASVAGLADPLLKSGHLQAALPPAHLVADAVSLLFFVIHPSSRYPQQQNPPPPPPPPPPSQEILPPDPSEKKKIKIKINTGTHTYSFELIDFYNAHTRTHVYIYFITRIIHVVRSSASGPVISIIYVCIYILFITCISPMLPNRSLQYR